MIFSDLLLILRGFKEVLHAFQSLEMPLNALRSLFLSAARRLGGL